MNPLDQLIQYLTKDPSPPHAMDRYTRRPIRYVPGYMRGAGGKGLARGKFKLDSKDIYITRLPSMPDDMIQDTTKHEILHSIFDTTDRELVENLRSQGPWKPDDEPAEFEHFLINSLLGTKPEYKARRDSPQMDTSHVLKMLDHVQGDESQMNAIDMIRRMIGYGRNR